MKLPSPAVSAFFVIFPLGLIAQSQVPNGPSAAPPSTREKVIEGAPFSADTIVVTETLLPNGEHVHKELRGRDCRDSQGRIYTDLGFRPSGGGEMPPIFILDPVAHTQVSLDPVRKYATIYDWPSRPLKLPSNGVPPPPEPRQPRTVKEEDLGTRIMEGLTVKGTRTTKTYSAESETIGADNSFVVTTWFSDELQISVLSELDSKGGSSKTSHVNIVRIEPSNSLFRIPSGYEVFDSRKQREAEGGYEKNGAETSLQQDLTWTDLATGLMWTKEDNGIGINWNQAKQYCRDMKVKGFPDWRLPTIDELRGIYDQEQNVGGYHIKGGIRLSLCCQWSSSTGLDSKQAWLLHFMSGGRVSGLFDYTFRVLCVRSPAE